MRTAAVLLSAHSPVFVGTVPGTQWTPKKYLLNRSMNDLQKSTVSLDVSALQSVRLTRQMLLLLSRPYI